MTRLAAAFRGIVKERGDELRKLTYKQLKQLDQTTERIVVGSRPAKISVIVHTLPSNGIRVVVQGFMEMRFFPMGWHVSLDGFYRYPDETTAPLTREDLWEFD